VHLADAEAPLYTPTSGWNALCDVVPLNEVRTTDYVLAMWEQASEYVSMVAEDIGWDPQEALEETARRVAGAMYLLATGEQPPAA